MNRSPIARSSAVMAVLVLALGLGAAAPVIAVGPGVAPQAPPHVAPLLWRIIPTGVTEDLTAVSAVTRTSAMAVAAPSSVLQWNGGAWLAWPAVAPGYITSIAMGSPVEARVVNAYGSARWDGSVWTFTFHPYAHLRTVEAISPTQFLAVGTAGAPLPDCIFYRSQGWTWQIEPVSWSGGCTALYDIDMASPDVGWVSGNDSTGAGPFFLRRSGSTWVQLYDPHALAIGRLAVVADNDVWLVADLQILHWNGTTWETIPNPSGRALRDIAMVSATDGWAVGEAGTILHWDGTGWSVVPGPTTVNLNGVAMLSPDYGWIVGDDGVALLYGDPGPGYHWVNLPVAMHNQPTPGR